MKGQQLLDASAGGNAETVQQLLSNKNIDINFKDI